MSDLTIFGQTFTNVAGIKATDTDGNEVVYGGGFSIEEIINRTISGDVVYNGTNATLRDAEFEVTHITSFEGNGITKAENGSKAFRYCPNLVSLRLPDLNVGSATSKLGQLCEGSGNLETVYMPNIGSTWSTSAFRLCRSLKNINIDSCVTLPQNTFQSCTALQEIVLPNCTKIMNLAFDSCYALENLVLKSGTLCALNHINGLQNTPLRGYNGTFSGHVYVPQSLIESYKTASNWSTLYANYPDIFLPIEGSEYE